MAEVFGVIGAGVGIAAAAGQLIDGIMKLRSFCSQIQIIPDDIQTAVDDMSTMVELLEFIQIEMDHETFPSHHSSSVKVLSNLQQSSQQVREVLEEMRMKLGKKRYWDRIKAVELTKKLEKASKRVENAQRMVLILLAVDNRILFRQNVNYHSVQTREVTATATHTLSIPNVDQSTRRISRDIREIDTGNSCTIDESSYNARSSPISKAKGYNTASIKLKLPQIFLKSVWEFSVYKANQGWNFSLRSYNIRPSNAPIFKAIRNGDLSQVHELLKSGEASIWDRNSLGTGVLHLAAQSCRENGPSILKYLVESGADIHDVNIEGDTPHSCLFTYDLNPVDQQMNLHLVEGYKVFTSHRDWMFPRPRMWVLYDNKNSRILSDMIEIFPIYKNPPEEIIRSVLHEMWPPWKELSPADRMKTLFPELVVSIVAISGKTISPLCVRECLSRECIQQTFATWGVTEKARLIKYTFSSLAQQLRRYDKGIKEARLFLQDMHMTDSLINMLPKVDFLGCFVREYVMDYIWGPDNDHKNLEQCLKVAQEGLKHYILELMILGIDMATVIDIQRNVLLIYRTFRVGRFGKEKCRIIAIDYGLNLDDWYLWLSNPRDEWAGEFWDMIDHPERAMPGAWEY